MSASGALKGGGAGWAAAEVLLVDMRLDYPRESGECGGCELGASNALSIADMLYTEEGLTHDDTVHEFLKPPHDPCLS